MIKKFDFLGKTDEQGRFKIYNRSQLEKFFQQYPDKKFVGHIEVEKEKVSDPFRRYYFGVVVHHWQIILRNLGYAYNLEQTHEYIKQFSPVTHEEVRIGDQFTRRLKSINELDREEFKQYVEDLKRVAATDADHYIPDPGEF